MRSITAAAVLSIICASTAMAQPAPVPPPKSGGSGPVPPPAVGGGGTGGATTGTWGTNAVTAPKPHLLVQMLPDAANCPAPEWIVPGTRITYFTSVAQINDAAGATNLVPDPNGNITDASGNKYREGDAVGMGVGGAGWDCLDVIAVEPGVVVLSMVQFFNSNGLRGPVTYSSTTPMMSHPSGCDYFLHPKLLAQLQQHDTNGVSLLKGTMQHRGANYDMVRSTVVWDKTRLSSVYDLTSGVQLTHNSSTQHDGGVAYKQSGDTYDSQRKTGRSLANNQFIEVRKINTPWETMKMPDWVRTMKRAQYRGQRVDSGTPEMGLGRLVTYQTIEYTTAHVGETYAFYTTRAMIQMENMPPMDPISSTAAYGPGSIGGLWMDPAALAKLSTGQLIDADSNIGVKTGAEYAGPGPDGRPIVVIASGNELYKMSQTYDARDGRLLMAAKIEKSASTGGMITTQMELVGME